MKIQTSVTVKDGQIWEEMGEGDEYNPNTMCEILQELI